MPLPAGASGCGPQESRYRQPRRPQRRRLILGRPAPRCASPRYTEAAWACVGSNNLVRSHSCASKIGSCRGGSGGRWPGLVRAAAIYTRRPPEACSRHGLRAATRKGRWMRAASSLRGVQGWPGASPGGGGPCGPPRRPNSPAALILATGIPLQGNRAPCPGKVAEKLEDEGSGGASRRPGAPRTTRGLASHGQAISPCTESWS